MHLSHLLLMLWPSFLCSVLDVFRRRLFSLQKVWIARCREKARTKDKNAGARAVETRSIAAAQRVWYDNGIIQCMISCDYGERG